MRAQHQISPETLPFLERAFLDSRRGRVGRFIGRVVGESISSDLDRRMRDEFESSLVESLDGRVNTHYDFAVVDGQVVAEDGERLLIYLDRAVVQADAMAAGDDYYADFLPQRTRNERREQVEIERMIADPSLGNTTVVLSPYSEEFDLGDGKLKHAFQRPDCQRAMLRISHYDGSRVHMIVRSLDSSSLRVIRQLASETFDTDLHSASSTQIQGHINRRVCNSTEEAEQLADKIAAQYDLILGMDANFSQGRMISRESDLQNEIAENHADIIDSLCINTRLLARNSTSFESFKDKLDGLMYDHIALAKGRINGELAEDGVLAEQIISAGEKAAERGDVYNVCGTILAGNKPAEMSAKTGLESLMLLSGKMIQCPNTDCRKMVVVDDSLLREGVLQCSHCANTVDVCGDKAKAAQYKKKLLKKRSDLRRKIKTARETDSTGFFTWLFGK